MKRFTKFPQSVQNQFHPDDFIAKSVFTASFNLSKETEIFKKYFDAYKGLEESGFKYDPILKSYACCTPPVCPPEPEPKGPGIYSFVKPTQKTIDLLTAWIAESKIPNPVPPDQLHSTVVYSKAAFSGYQPRDKMTIVNPSQHDQFGTCLYDGYGLRRLGPDLKALVLTFYSVELSEQFWQANTLGASWDHQEKIQHITLSYDIGDFDISSLTPPCFELNFDPEQTQVLQEDWAKNNDLKKFEIKAQIKKIDEDKRLVYGWANVIEVGGNQVVDYQKDTIDEEELVQAAHDFVENSRVAKVSHNGGQKGTIVESLVFTRELQKQLGIDLNMTGWLIGVKVNDEPTWQSIKKGDLKMFSIGGQAYKVPVYE